MRSMAANWLGVMRGMEDEIGAIARTMAQRRAQGLEVTAGYLYRTQRYQALLQQAYGQFIRYEDFAADLIGRNQALFARLGREYGLGLLDMLEPGIGGGFERLSVGAIENMAGFVSPGSPLRSLLADAWPQAIQQTTGALVKGVALGYGPERIAKMMNQGMSSGLYRSMVIARSETQRAYRTAKQSVWAESGLVEGMQRVATHDRRTCPACLMRDGEFIPITETMAEHPNGRCQMVPCRSRKELHKWQYGEQWLEEQPTATQVSILGRGRYDAWQAGKIDLRDIPAVQTNDTWGATLRARGVAELMGDAPRGIRFAVSTPPVTQPKQRIPAIVRKHVPDDIADNLPKDGRLAQLADEAIARLERNEIQRNAAFTDEGLSGRLARSYDQAKYKPSQEIHQFLDQQLRVVESLKKSVPRQADLEGLDVYRMRRDLIDGHRREERFRREYYKEMKQLASISESQKRNGVIVLEQSEVESLLGRVGDAYIDAGWSPEQGRPQYNPSLFKTSDLSGAKVRHYIEFPDGRIGHPDEINEARERKRILIIGEIKVPSRDWTIADE